MNPEAVMGPFVWGLEQATKIRNNEHNAKRETCCVLRVAWFAICDPRFAIRDLRFAIRHSPHILIYSFLYTMIPHVGDEDVLQRRGDDVYTAHLDAGLSQGLGDARLVFGDPFGHHVDQRAV